MADSPVPIGTIKGNPAFEIARRDARVLRLMEALRTIAAGEVHSVMEFAGKAWSYEIRMEEDYERG